MIQNDLQRLRWQFLDEALRDPVLEFSWVNAHLPTRQATHAA